MSGLEQHQSKQGNNIQKPNFLILGAAKSGTNSLYNYLREHPEVFMSTPKEPWFFEAEYERGLKFYWDCYFKGWSGQRVVGEARVANLFLPYVAPRIKESLPDAKLIVILRNPVDRAYSHWWMHYARGNEKLSFADALQENLRRIAAGQTLEGEEGEKFWRSNISPDKTHNKVRCYLDVGYYAIQIKRYLQLFPSSQIKIILFDDFCQQPQSVFQELWHFLGVEPKMALPEIVPQFAGLTQAAIPFLRVERALKLSKVVPKSIAEQLRTLLCKFGNRPQMDEGTKHWLSEHYYAHNRELEKIVGRDLSAWDKIE